MRARYGDHAISYAATSLLAGGRLAQIRVLEWPAVLIMGN